MQDRQLTAGGLEFAYIQEGSDDAPLALCLHGFPDHAPSFRSLLTALAGAGFRAVAPWMRGYAPTQVPADGSYHVASLAADALALADELASERPAVLIGHDWGAICAYLAVRHRPDRFARLVTLAAPPGMGGSFTNPQQLKRSWYMFFFQMPFAAMAVQAKDFAFIDMLWEDWSPGYRHPAGAMAELKQTLGAPGSLDAALGYYRAMFGGSRPGPDVADLAGSVSKPVTVPTLYLHGRQDGCLGADLVTPQQWESQFPAGIDVEVLDGAGHFLHLEQSDVVNERIVKFLSPVVRS